MAGVTTRTTQSALQRTLNAALATCQSRTDKRHPLIPSAPRPAPRVALGSGPRSPCPGPGPSLLPGRSGGAWRFWPVSLPWPLSPTWVSPGIGDRGRRNAGFAESRRSLGSTPRGVHSKGEGKAGHPERHQTATHDPDDRHGRSQTAGPHPKDRTGPGGGAGQRAEGGALPTCWAGEGRSPHATH